MKSKAQELWEVFKAELIVQPTEDQRKALSTSIRTLANMFEYDSYGLAELCADDFYEIADELDELNTFETVHSTAE